MFCVCFTCSVFALHVLCLLCTQSQHKICKANMYTIHNTIHNTRNDQRPPQPWRAIVASQTATVCASQANARAVGCARGGSSTAPWGQWSMLPSRTSTVCACPTPPPAPCPLPTPDWGSATLCTPRLARPHCSHASRRVCSLVQVLTLGDLICTAKNEVSYGKCFVGYHVPMVCTYVHDLLQVTNLPVARRLRSRRA